MVFYRVYLSVVAMVLLSSCSQVPESAQPDPYDFEFKGSILEAKESAPIYWGQEEAASCQDEIRGIGKRGALCKKAQRGVLHKSDLIRLLEDSTDLNRMEFVGVQFVTGELEGDVGVINNQVLIRYDKDKREKESQGSL